MYINGLAVHTIGLVQCLQIANNTLVDSLIVTFMSSLIVVRSLIVYVMYLRMSLVVLVLSLATIGC